MANPVHYDHGELETLTLCGKAKNGMALTGNVGSVTCLHCVRMLQTDGERDCKKVLRLVRSWLDKHSEVFGRNGRKIITQIMPVLDAFAEDPDEFLKTGGDTEVANIGGRLTINRRRIATFDADTQAAAKRAWEVAHG